MRKYSLILLLAGAVIFFANCHTAKKASTASKLTYDVNIKTLVIANCSPCHVPSKGGNKKSYDNYANASGDIDDILRRIQLNPTDRGFMPFKGAKLSDATIAIFKQWKADGAPEK